MSKGNSGIEYEKTIFQTKTNKESTLIITLLLNHSDPMFPFVSSGSQNGTLAQNWLKMFFIILSILR